MAFPSFDLWTPNKPVEPSDDGAGFADLRRDDTGSGKFQKSTLRDASHDSLL